MSRSAFDILILLGRPAAGKSELIRYLRSVPAPERRRRFHIGDFEEFDDFPMLWTWFEEDAILSEMGRPRLHTTPDGYFKERWLWDLLVRRIGLEYRKRRRDRPGYHRRATALIEFSRGTEHGGYRQAFENLDEAILERAAVLYIRVSWEESLRKNRRRFNPERPDSILQHALPDEELERLYRHCDWEELSGPDTERLPVRGRRVPYGVLENQDDLTTAGGEPLGRRLEEVLGRVWRAYAG
jgi:hypothetical protein